MELPSPSPEEPSLLQWNGRTERKRARFAEIVFRAAGLLWLDSVHPGHLWPLSEWHKRRCIKVLSRADRVADAKKRPLAATRWLSYTIRLIGSDPYLASRIV